MERQQRIALKVSDPERVFVGVVNEHFLSDNLSQFWIGFNGKTSEEDAYYIALYLGQPISKITHIAIVDSKEYYDGGVWYYFKTIIKLKEPIGNRYLRKYEVNWSLADFNLKRENMDELRNLLNKI